MATTHKGSCSCGAIKIELQGDPSFVALCHCHNCQKSTSSTYSTNWVYPSTSFTLTSGEPTTYAVGGANKALRKFCGVCSCVMWTETEKFPGIVVVKAGVVDGGGIAGYRPATEAFTDRRPEWVGCVEGARQFGEAFKG